MKYVQNLFKQYGESITLASLILVLGYSGIVKAIHYENHLSVIDTLYFRNVLIDSFYYVLPYLEIIIILALLTENYKKYGAIASLLLMTSFTFYIIILYIFSPDTPCNCGGVLTFLNFYEHLILNFYLLFCSYYLIKKYRVDPTDIDKHLI